MRRHSFLLLSFSICLVLTISAGCSREAAMDRSGDLGDYSDLVEFFHEWREFQKPKVVDGVPDYSAEAMRVQHRELAEYLERLHSIDTTGWSISHQVDWHIVRAEMAGLDFDHNVHKPWSRMPAFYTMIFPSQSDVPAHEGPVVDGWIDLWTYDYPLSSEAAAELTTRIGSIPALLEHARENLVENARDLWRSGIRAMEIQSADLSAFAERTAGTSEDLAAAIENARNATNAFHAWLEEELPNKTGPSGIGVDNYNWYLKNVHLVPYTWEEELALMRRALARSHAALRLEENRHRNLPALTRVSSAAQYDRLFNAAVTEYMEFLEEQEIVEIRPYMDFALRERIGRFSPADGLRGFFSEVSYRDPIVMRTHGYHWFDLAMMANDPHESPIRSAPLLYNIWDSRAEGIATGMEEWMMLAGFLEDRPRARELIYILIAQRAARAISGLLLHSNEFDIDEAVEFAAEWTPRGWMPPESNTVWGEQYFYLQQPYYGASYLMGKHQVEMFLAERANQLGEDFSIKRFFDEINASGLIPMSLIRWEIGGDAAEVVELTSGH